jgi:hypothetical protein
VTGRQVGTAGVRVTMIKIDLPSNQASLPLRNFGSQPCGGGGVIEVALILIGTLVLLRPRLMRTLCQDTVRQSHEERHPVDVHRE